MAKEPHRFRAIYGAARAAAAAGNRDLASQHYRHLIEICTSSDTERPELKEARQFIGRKLDRFQTRIRRGSCRRTAP